MLRHLFLLLLLCACSGAWTTDELELFDLVEEINENFYTILGVSQDANGTDIKKAFRRLSLVLHPDKNDAPDAAEKFRQLVAVYEVLHDDERRARYDRLLVEGLPDWHMPIYYYRRVRKMGLAEMFVLLFFIITIGQYIVAWASYWETKFHELFNAKKKKKVSRKSRHGRDAAASEDVPVIPKPSWFDTLPFQLFRLTKFLILSTPSFLLYCQEYVREWWTRPPPEPEPSESSSDEELVEKKKKRRRVFELPDLTGSEQLTDTLGKSGEDDVTVRRPVSGGLWTDDDISELARLVRKYPAGVPSRWERIAELMKRTVEEVTFVARTLKESSYRPPPNTEKKTYVQPVNTYDNITVRDDCDQTDDSEAEEDEEGEKEKEEEEEDDDENYGVVMAEAPPPPPSPPRKVKTKGGKLGKEDTAVDGAAWNQVQQKALECALQQFPQGVLDRWDRIAKAVPGKTKKECMLRYKHLVEVVKKKKEETLNDEEPSGGQLVITHNS